MRVTRSGVVLLTALVATVLGPLASPSPAVSAPAEVARFSFSGPCAGVPGEMHVRQQRLDDRVSRVTMRASGIPDRRWGGEITIQTRRYAESATFRTTSTDGVARRSARFSEPVGRGPVSGSLYDYESQAGCDVGGSYGAASVQVDAAIHLMASVGDDGLLVSASMDECRRGSVWRGRMIAVFPGRTVRQALPGDTCRYGAVSVGRALPGLGLPNHIEVTLRDDADHVQRVTYRIVRG